MSISRDRIEARQEQLNALYAKTFGLEEQPVSAPVPTPPATEELDDSDIAAILEVATRAKNGDLFNKLWAGDWAAAGYPSQSEADLALCGSLAFYVGNDPAGLDAVFRQSGLFRDKWEDREGYRTDTIGKALAGREQFYDWGLRDAEARVDGIVGAAQPETLPQPAPKQQEKPKRRGYFFDELMSLPPCTWQINKIIPSQSVVCLYGPSQSGKSFVAIDWAACVATGKPWLGDHKVARGKVVYVAAEGEHGIRKRLQAWRDHYGYDLGRDLLVVPFQFNLLDDDDPPQHKLAFSQSASGDPPARRDRTGRFHPGTERLRI